MQLSHSAFPKDLVIYQVYPRSFQDSNDDGVGDLPGIINRLDYLERLGITAIWLNPIFPSPMVDCGYDVSKYRAIDPLFGNLSDMDRLIKQAHKKNIRVILDMVFNHTSIEHDWFVESRSSRNHLKRNWYVWKEPKPDGSPPNNWLSVFGGSAWEQDKKTGQYYLHSFLKEQPDLNWRNPEVRSALREVARFWLERGVDGLRMDAVYYYAKDPNFADDPVNPTYKKGQSNPYDALLHHHSLGHQDVYKFLNEIADELKHYRNRFMVTEAYPEHPLNPSGYDEFYKKVNYLVAAPFNFEAFYLPWEAKSFRQHINNYQASLKPNYTPVYVFGNHDKPRLASRYSPAAMPAAALLLLTLPGASVIYYGEELGLEDVPIPKDVISDTFEKNVPNLGLGRDPARTPMQWSSKKYAGFSNNKPWLPLEANYKSRNVEAEEQNKDSLLNIYKQLLKLRHSRVLQFGKYEQLPAEHKEVFGFVRSYHHYKLKVLINFSSTKQIEIKEGGKVIFSTIGERHINNQLAPSEGLILK